MPQAARRSGRWRSLALALALLAASLSANVQARPSTHACDFYHQLGARCSCPGADDYFRSYGQKYCERFMRATGWSPAALRWRDRTLGCLKNELRQFMSQAGGCRCAAVKAFAFASHARCYTAAPASVCRLPLPDLRRIYGIVDAADLLDPAGSRQTLAITLACVWQNGNAEARPDRPSP